MLNELQERLAAKLAEAFPLPEYASPNRISMALTHSVECACEDCWRHAKVHSYIVTRAFTPEELDQSALPVADTWLAETIQQLTAISEKLSPTRAATSLLVQQAPDSLDIYISAKVTFQEGPDYVPTTEV